MHKLVTCPKCKKTDCKMDNRIIIDRDDLIHLLTMYYGYINDELGGFKISNVHTSMYFKLLRKYDIDITEVLDNIKHWFYYNVELENKSIKEYK